MERKQVVKKIKFKILW